MKKFQNWLKFLFVILFIFSNNGCKHEKIVKPTGTTISNSDGKVFINASDPRIAEIKRDGNRITFYGLKDAAANPLKLTGYRIQSLTDTSKNDYVNFDDQGRYSTISMRTGQLIKFSYSNKDSVIVSLITTHDTVSVFKLKYMLKGNSVNFKKVQSLKTNSIAQKTDIKIKVVARNKLGVDRDIDDSQVIVRMLGTGNEDYSLEATHMGSGIYSVPIPGDFLSTNTQIIDETVSFLQDALAVACFDCDSGCNQTFVETLTPLCILPGTDIICAYVLPVVIFACKFKANDLAAYFGDLLKTKVDEYSIPDNAAVITYSQNFSLGLKYANQATISDIKQNASTGYDIIIVYDDNSIIGSWDIAYTWSGEATGYSTITFNSDNTFVDAQAESGVYVQNKNQVTFTFNNTTQYRGSGDVTSNMSGTMVDYNGVPGTWSMSR